MWKENARYSLYFKAFIRIMVAYLSLENAWQPTIFFLDSNKPCYEMLFSQQSKPWQKFLLIGRRRP